MTTILFFSTALYFFINRWLLSGLRKLKSYEAWGTPRVSVLICARNEESNIIACLDSIFSQNYPENLFEVLIANDRSTDETLSVLNSYKEKHPRLTIISIKEVLPHISPKKNAMTKLISSAKGEIILTTDADCIVPENWIGTIAGEFRPDTDMVVGFSTFSVPKTGKNWFWSLQALEFFSHFVVSSAAIANQLPINSSGNSLAYRRLRFEEVNGFTGIENIASGDDDLLLHKFSRERADSIRFCINPKSYVQTEAQMTLSGLWEQRKRWASKTVYYNSKVVALLTTVFVHYTLILVSILLGYFVSPTLFYFGCIAFLIKTFGDYVVVLKGTRIFNKPDLLPWFLLTAVFHIPLIVGAVFFGIFGKFNWKGRSSHRQSTS